MNNKKIFLFEDNPIVSMDIFYILKKAGFNNIRIFRKADLQNEKVEHDLQDVLIIFDLSKSNEEPVINFINSRLEKKEINNIVVTGLNIGRIKAKIKCKSTFYISKPFVEKDLLDVVSNCF